MNNNNELIKQYSKTHPGLGTYMECMSRALMTGVAGLGLSFGGCYFAQNLLKDYLPYPLKVKVLISSLIAVAFSYNLTTKRTKYCQDMWMVMEDKHSTLNPISEKTLKTE